MATENPVEGNTSFTTVSDIGKIQAAVKDYIDTSISNTVESIKIATEEEIKSMFKSN